MMDSNNINPKSVPAPAAELCVILFSVFMVALLLGILFSGDHGPVTVVYATGGETPVPTATPTPTTCPTYSPQLDVYEGDGSHFFDTDGPYFRYGVPQTLTFEIYVQGGCSFYGCVNDGSSWNMGGGTLGAHGDNWAYGTFSSTGKYTVTGTADGFHDCPVPPSSRGPFSDSGDVYMCSLTLGIDSGIAGTDNGMPNSRKMCSNSTNRNTASLSINAEPNSIPNARVELSISGPALFSSMQATHTLYGTDGTITIRDNNELGTGEFTVTACLYSGNTYIGQSQITGRVFYITPTYCGPDHFSAVGDNPPASGGQQYANVDTGVVYAQTGSADNGYQWQGFVKKGKKYYLQTTPSNEYSGNATFDLTVQGDAADLSNYGVCTHATIYDTVNVSLGLNYGFLSVSWSLPTEHLAGGAVAGLSYINSTEGTNGQISLNSQYGGTVISCKPGTSSTITGYDKTLTVGNSSSYITCYYDLRTAARKDNWGSPELYAYTYARIDTFTITIGPFDL